MDPEASPSKDSNEFAFLSTLISNADSSGTDRSAVLSSEHVDDCPPLIEDEDSDDSDEEHSDEEELGEHELDADEVEASNDTGDVAVSGVFFLSLVITTFFLLFFLS